MADDKEPSSASAYQLVDTFIPALAVAAVYLLIFMILRRSHRRFYAPRTYLGTFREQYVFLMAISSIYTDLITTVRGHLHSQMDCSTGLVPSARFPTLTLSNISPLIHTSSYDSCACVQSSLLLDASSLGRFSFPSMPLEEMANSSWTCYRFQTSIVITRQEDTVCLRTPSLPGSTSASFSSLSAARAFSTSTCARPSSCLHFTPIASQRALCSSLQFQSSIWTSLACARFSAQP